MTALYRSWTCSFSVSVLPSCSSPDLEIAHEVDAQPQPERSARALPNSMAWSIFSSASRRGDVLDGGGVLGDLGEPLRLRKFDVRDDEAVDGVDGVLRFEADTLDRFDGLVRGLGTDAVRLREGSHRERHLVGVGGVLRRTERSTPWPS